MENLNFTNLVFDDLPGDIQHSIKSIISKQNYLTFEVHSKNISTNGNNFLGDLFEVDIEGQNEGTNYSIHLFLKHIIYNEDFKVYSIPEVYMKEVFFYKDLSKKYTDLQEQAKVPLHDRLNVVKCYEETNPECIILENLSKKGYKTMRKMEVMTFEFAQLSVQELAKFHALSFVMQNKNQEYFETKIKTIKQSFRYEEDWNNFIKKMYEVSTSRFSGEIKYKLDKFFELSLEKYPKYKTGIDSDFKVLCHGDYKMNNILYKETEGVVTEVIPVDYQQIYYGNPVIDLIYFLYASSDKTFRTNYLEILKDLYFKTLKRILKHFKINIDSVCPRDVFERSFKDCIEYALMYTLYMLPMFGYVVENAPSAKDNLMEMKLKIHDRFYVIMEEIVEEFVEKGIL